MATDLFAKLKWFLCFSLMIGSFTQNAQSSEVSIVNAKRNIPLSDSEKVYKDFYLNVGSQAGFKRNSVLNVYRKQLLSDATGTQSLGELKILVGQLKVIALDRNLAVAREVKLTSRDNEPMLDQIGIMIGDLVEVASTAGR